MMETLMPLTPRARQKRRLLRQFGAMERRIPALRGPLRLLLSERGGIVRMGAAVLCLVGGLLSFLPFLGIWLLPLGFLLLAVDVPPLRLPASAFVIRGRRWTTGKVRRFRSARQA
jgi:hypothetical protein